MQNKQLIVFLTLASLLVISACSSTKVRELTTVELAQQLLADQNNNKNLKIQHPMTIDYTVPEKAIMGKEMDVIVEISSKIALPGLTLAFDTSRDLQFKNSWLVISKDSVVEKIKEIKADKLYRRTVTVIPDNHGLIYIDVYALYNEGKDKRVKHRRITFSIGDALSKDKASQHY